MNRLYRYLLFAAIVAVASPSAGAPMAVLIRQPVGVTINFGERPVDLQGQLNLDVRITSEAIKRHVFIGEVRNLGLVLRGVESDKRVLRRVDGMKRLVNIGVSVVPGTKVEFRYDSSRKLLHWCMEVEIDLPHTGRYARDKTFDATTQEVQKGSLQIRLSLPNGLSSLATGSRSKVSANIDMTLIAREYSDSRIQMKPFSARIFSDPQKRFLLDTIDTATNDIYNVVCLQPISIASTVGDTQAAGYQEGAGGTPVRNSMEALQSEIDSVWGVIVDGFPGLSFAARPWKVMQAPELKVIGAGSEDLLSNAFPDIDPDCVEIYFVERIEDRFQNGAITNGWGTAEAQIIFSDEILVRGVKGRLAHELGHVVRIPHIDSPRRGDRYEGTPGTAVCVYSEWETHHPLRNSAENITHVWIPAELQFDQIVRPKSKALRPACQGPADCGSCDTVD